MRFYPLCKVAFPCLAVAAVCLQPIANTAQEVHAIRIDTRTGSALQAQVSNPSGSAIPQHPVGAITLDPPAGLDLQADTVRSNGETLPPEPANFRRLGEARVGEVADLHTLTLRFNQTTKITGISVTKDFKIEQGGSCVEGNVYQKGTACRMLVRFTPQGPGNRLGKLTIANSASATPDTIGLGGFGYSPVLSFIPSIITTVPGTYPSSKGLLSGANDLTVDASDMLYIADTGNTLIRKIDSSGTISNVTPVAAPLSIAVDTFGFVYSISADTSHYFSYYPPYGGFTFYFDAYSAGTCTQSAPCDLGTVGMGNPHSLSIDSANNLFLEEETKGAMEAPVGGVAGYLGLIPTIDVWYLQDKYASFTGAGTAMTVNANDYLFTVYSSPTTACLIVEEPAYEAGGTATPPYTRVAGGAKCGYSGDGGQAGNAEIGSAIGQIAFDAAGDLYFTDTSNQRVRRIDYNTGIIRTIAGTGAAGYTNDGGMSTYAELSSPTGLAVDSQGQVYIISSAATGQVIREVSAIGVRNLGNTLKGATSATSTVLVTNTGNSPLNLVNTSWTGPDVSEFHVDPTVTNCPLTAGAVLNSGQTCQIGFYAIPAAAGYRWANFNLLGNTVNNSNTIELFLTGTLPSAAVKFTSPANNSSYASGATIAFTASVTSGSGPAPHRQGAVQGGRGQPRVSGRPLFRNRFHLRYRPHHRLPYPHGHLQRRLQLRRGRPHQRQRQSRRGG